MLIKISCLALGCLVSNLKGLNMEKFQDINHYQTVIDDFSKAHDNLVGNITTVKREIEGVISEGRLFYSIYPHTLLLFRDEIDFWQTMLLTDGKEEEINLPEGKPYASLVSNALKKGNAKEILHGKLISMGINLVEIYSSYRTDIIKSYPVAKSFMDDMDVEMKEKGYEFLPFQDKYIEEIHALWNKYLKRYHFPKEQWNFEFDRDNVLLLFDTKTSSPKLVATVYFFKKDASYLSSGLAVDVDYRHDMLGIYIDAMQLCLAYEAGLKWMYSWKLDGNKKAIKLGEMFGTEKMLLGCQQYYSGQ